ncbi:MAG TPA: sporulation protein YabP [Bacillota bacterium]|nr:sporulation protein YabP [Bacillota bacterium]HOL10127.1 sporulation protein YabP [Bacillota bacterium]HPO97877.1 sporulation protein YabP [Bacillota bacterium]
MDSQAPKAVDIPHQINLSNRGLLGVDGVLNLESYDQEKIIMQTSVGVLEVKGEKLHIQQLNLDQGKVKIDGVISALTYNDDLLAKKTKGLFSRLAK